MYRLDPTHAGYTDEKLTFPLKLAWNHSIPMSVDDVQSNVDNPSSPVVSDGIAYFCAGRRLYAVSTETGALKWKYPDDQPLTAIIKSTPLIGQDLIYFGAGDGKLYAIRKQDGQHAWSFYTKGIMNSSPVLVDGVLYVGSSDDHLYALDPGNGQMKWRGGFKTRDDVSTSPAVANGLVYFVSNDMMLYSVHTATGRIKWMAKVGAASRTSTPVLSGNRLYIAVGNVMQCFNSMSGRLEFSVPMSDDITTTPAVADGFIYYACRNGKLYSVNGSGKLRWKTPVDIGAAAYGSPIVAKDTVVIGADKGILLAADKDTGELRWKYFVAPTSPDKGKLKYTDLASSPAVIDGALYVLSDDATLHAFRMDQPDSTPPQVTAFEPQRDVVMNGAPPVQIAAVITDPGTGVNPETISFTLDNQPVAYKYKPETGTLWYRTPKTQPIITPLSDGPHSVTLAVSDWAGNKTTMSWRFSVDNRIAKKADDTSKTAAPGTPGSRSSRSSRNRNGGGMPGMGGGMPGMGGGGMPGMGGGGMPGMGGR